MAGEGRPHGTNPLHPTCLQPRCLINILKSPTTSHLEHYARAYLQHIRLRSRGTDPVGCLCYPAERSSRRQAYTRSGLIRSGWDTPSVDHDRSPVGLRASLTTLRFAEEGSFQCHRLINARQAVNPHFFATRSIALRERDANRRILIRGCKPVSVPLCGPEELLHLVRRRRCWRPVRIEWPCELTEEAVELPLAHGY
jgi:hypothetical protein